MNPLLIVIFFIFSACSLMGPPELGENEELAKKILKDCPTCFHHPNKEHKLGFYQSLSSSKQTILFIHGSPGSWTAYASHILDKRLARFERVAIDRPGYKSSKKTGYEKSLPGQAKYAYNTLDKSSTNKVVIVAHSYGVPVAVQMALDYPEKIKGLVLVAGSVDPELEKTKWFQIPAKYPPLSWIIPNALNVCNKEILALKPELFIQKELLSQLKLPITVIQGEDDDLVPKENADYLKKYLTNASLKTIMLPNKNHFILWSEKDLVINETLKLLK